MKLQEKEMKIHSYYQLVKHCMHSVLYYSGELNLTLQLNFNTYFYKMQAIYTHTAT